MPYSVVACGARRKPATGAGRRGRRARSTPARWPSCASRSALVGRAQRRADRRLRLDRLALRRARRHRFTYLGFGWVPQPTRGADAGLLVACSAWRSLGARRSGGAPGCAALGVLVALGVDRADRRHHLPQPLLVPHPGGALAVVAPLGAGVSLDARRAGGPTHGGPRAGCGCCGSRWGWSTPSPAWPSSRPTGSCGRCPLRLWLPARADLPLSGGCWASTATAHALRRRRRRCSTASSCRSCCGGAPGWRPGSCWWSSTSARGPCSRSASSPG